MIIRDAVETRSRRRVRLLFAGVVVVFFAQFIGGKMWGEPIPGLFAPEFSGNAIKSTSEKARSPRTRDPKLSARFKDGAEEVVPLEKFVRGVYYKQRKRFPRAFLKHLKQDRPETTSQLVTWLIEKYSDAAPKRTLVQLSWIDVSKDGPEATTTIWVRDPSSD